MKRLFLHQHAENELWEEVAYYEKEVQGLGLDFLSEAEEAFRRIRVSPQRWQRANYGTQYVLLRRFPHTIFYRDLPEAVWVVAIAPQKRRPFYWRYRVEESS